MIRAGESGAKGFSGPAIWIFVSVALAPPAEFFLRPLWGAAGAASLTAGALAAGTLCMAAYSLYAGGKYRGGVSGLWLSGLIAVAILSAGAGRDIFGAFPALFDLQLAATAFLLAAVLTPEERRRFGRLLPAGMILGGALAASYALIQFSPGAESQFHRELAGLPQYLRDAARARLEQGRAFSFFVYPNAFAGYLLFGFPATLARLLDRDRRIQERVFWGALALLLGSGFLASGSMGAAACLLAAFGLTIFLTGKRSAGFIIFSLITAAVILGAVIAARGPASLAENGLTKIRHWQTAVKSPAGARQLILGQGPGRYGEAAGMGMGESLRSRLAHNWPVQAYVETGILGVGILLCLLGALAKAIFWDRPGPASPDIWGLKVGWLAWLLHSLVDINYALPLLAFPWWCAGGYLAALGARQPKPGAPARRRLESPNAGLAGARAAAIFISAGILIVPYFVGSAAALVYGAFLAAGAGWTVFRSLTEFRKLSLYIRTDWPWLWLLVLGLAWVVAGRIPDAACRVGVEAMGLFGIMLMARKACVRPEFRAEPLMRTALLASVSIYALWGITQFILTGNPAQAGFPSPNLFASFMLAGFLLGLGSMLRVSGPARSATGISLALSGVAMAAAGASGPLLAAAALAACVLPAALGAKKRQAALITAAGIAALGGTWLAFASLDAISVSQRATMWREAARLLRAAPAGIGPGAYAAATEGVREPSVTAAGIGRYSLRALFAHNEPLQFAAEWGIPALGLLLLGFITVFIRGRRPALRGWEWSLAGLLLLGLVDFPLRVPACKLICAAAAGILTSGGFRMRTIRRRGGTPGLSFAALGPAAAIGILVAIAFMRPAAARRILERTGPDPQRAVVAAARAQSASPLSAEPHFLRAQAEWRFMQSLGSVDSGSAWRILEELRRAYLLSGKDTEIGITLGYFLFSSGDMEGAKETFMAAAAGAPTRPHPWLWIARISMGERDWAGALEALEQARRREPFFLEALADLGRLEELRGNRAAARGHYRAALVLRAKLSQRKEMNPYEAALCRLDEEYVKGRLLDLGSGP